MMDTGQWLYEAFRDEMVFPNMDKHLVPWGMLKHVEQDAWARLEIRVGDATMAAIGREFAA